MTDALNTMKNSIEQLRYNPTNIQRVILRTMRDISDNHYEFVDPNNPVVNVIEAAATIGASCMVENANNNRKQYSSVSQTMEDLYRHMAYDSFTDIFALPCNAGFLFSFSKQELIARMVQVGNTGIRKIVIPRNTTVQVGDTVFSLQYPIEIRQLLHGELQITYDVERTTPLQVIETNLIEWNTNRDSNGEDMVFFPVMLKQFEVISLVDVVNNARKFSLSKNITDKFYYCRVWREMASGEWVEIRTTYSQDIYDNRTVTAIVKVIDKQVTVEIPIVYTKTNQISGKIRVDIYQTKGPMSADLRKFDKSQFTVRWLALDNADKSIFTAPLNSMATTTIYGATITNGGREPMTFDQLKARVTSNGYSADEVPITPAQARSKLERDGYNIVTDMDNITNRVFAATRAMPEPIDNELITPANAGIHTLQESLANLARLSTSYSNFNSLTLTPKALYKVVKGVLTICSDSEIALINALPGDKKAQAVTEGGYFYTPFHYVLDTSNNTFKVRAYHLDSPVINSRSFIAENETTELQVATGGALFNRTADGWELIVTTRSSKEWKALPDNQANVTIGFQPDNSGDYAYVRGILLGIADSGERVFSFPIKTNYDIDANNGVQLTNAMMYEISQQFLRTQLTQKYDLFYSTNSVMPVGWEPSNFDLKLGSFLLPDGSVGISRERMELSFGTSLTNLWSSGRSVVGDKDYAVWEVDVPALYENDVYQVDPVTGASFTIVNGVLTYNKLHTAGEPRLDPAGQPIMKYHKGRVKKDAYGNPVIISERGIMRQIDLFLVEAPYYFATNKAAIDYRKYLVDTIVTWIDTDLRAIGKKLLDKTNIYFYPVQSVGIIDVVYGAGLKMSINAGQYFNLKLYVTDSVYKNPELRAALIRTTVVTINECTKAKTVSNAQLNDALRLAYASDVIAFDQEGLGGEAQLTVATVVDDSARMTIRKRLEYRPDQTFALVDDVTCEFVPHERAGVTLSRS